MYDENDKLEFNNINPEEPQIEPQAETNRPEEPITTGFIMSDPEPQEQDRSEAETVPMQPAYQNQHGQNQYSNIPPEPDRRRKKPGMAKKVAGITAAALLFGMVSGGTMVGINWAANSYRENNSVKVNLSETIGETMAAETQGGNAVQATAALTTDVSTIVEKAMPSVVAINSTTLYQSQSNPWFGAQTYEVPSSGSGIIVGQNDSELLVVTNNHVVADSQELKVTFIDNTAITATIKGTNAESDLAVIAIKLTDIPAETLSKITIASMGDSDALKVGQGVIAIGNALGYGQSVTVGYVSALNRAVQTEDQSSRDLLQTDAAINPGNSGGALLNMRGEVIGINAAKYSSTDVEGMGYAIPISKAKDIIDEMMNYKTRVLVDENKQGYLGIRAQSIDDTMSTKLGMPKGIYIYQIVEDGAASQSDLREKDIITKVDGQSVYTQEDLQKLLTFYEGGSTVSVTVQSLENGQYVERVVEVKLGFRPVEQVDIQK